MLGSAVMAMQGYALVVLMLQRYLALRILVIDPERAALMLSDLSTWREIAILGTVVSVPVFILEVSVFVSERSGIAGFVCTFLLLTSAIAVAHTAVVHYRVFSEPT